MTTSVAEPSDPAIASPFRFVPVHALVPSGLNPRKHFDQTKLEELAATMGNGIGIIEPLVVRPTGVSGAFEIVAGERRWRSARIAQLEEIPILIKDLTDAQVLELMVIENDQREDINPLEEGDGFKRLMTFGFDIDVLAGRIGRSRKYIYDRVKLLDLVEPACTLMLEGRITAGHAILLARLSPAQQLRALAVGKHNGYGSLEGALFEEEERLWSPDEREDVSAVRKKDPYHGMKVRSVRELDAWIDQHCRFEPLAAVNQELFPATIAAVETAEKVVSITHNHHVDPDAKEGSSERIFSTASWKRADGLQKSRVCDRSVTGVIVVGPGRGEAFKVCVHKDCDIHWRAEKRAKEKAAAAPAAAKQSREAETARWERERQAREAKQKAWVAARPEMFAAIAAKVRSAPIGKVIEQQLDALLLADVKAAMGLMSLKTAVPEEALRVMFLARVLRSSDFYRADEFTKTLKVFGVDVAGLLKKQVQPSAEAKSKAKAVKKSATAKAKGKR